MAFVTGPQITPPGGTAQFPVDLMEGLTAMQAASLVPFVKIVQVDPRTGKEVPGRGLMYDLVQTPQFGAMAGFGNDPEAFRERGLVSLNSLRVQTQMEYGFISYAKVDLEFTVHQPQVVLDRGSDVQWRTLLEPMRAFTLEYGWRSDPSIVHDNPVFNGEGWEDPQTHRVIRPTKVLTIAVYSYDLRLRGNGEVDVTVHALENGDIALREMRLLDVLDENAPTAARNIPNDEKREAAEMAALFSKITVRNQTHYTLKQLVGEMLYPLVHRACTMQGYSDVDLVLGNFNSEAGALSKEYGGETMAGRSIADFKIPVGVAKNMLSFPMAKGRSLTMHLILSSVLEEVNSTRPWTAGQTSSGKPNVALQATTVRTDSGLKLILTALDRKVKEHQIKGLRAIPVEQQTRQRVMEALRRNNIPIIEFGRAGSLILEAGFEVQPDGLFQSILMERAYKDPRDRAQIAAMPDAVQRLAKVTPQEILPLSILKGSITFLGNFVFELFSGAWIEYFGSDTISGIYHVLQKTDVVEPGSFKSELEWISEGIDPLNTRRKLSDEQLKARDAARKALPKPTKPPAR